MELCDKPDVIQRAYHFLTSKWNEPESDRSLKTQVDLFYQYEIGLLYPSQQIVEKTAKAVLYLKGYIRRKNALVSERGQGDKLGQRHKRQTS